MHSTAKAHHPVERAVREREREKQEGGNSKLLQYCVENRHCLAVLQSETLSILDKAPFRSICGKK